MVRITVHEEGPGTRFLVEGKLVGPWVAELRKCWEEMMPIPGQQTVIDLAGVTSIDSHGKELLAEMHRQGMQLVATGLMTQAIVEDIQRARVQRQ